MLTNILIAFAYSFLISVIFIHYLRYWLLERSMLDIPNHRSSHTVPTPRGGGIGIFLVVTTGLLCFLPFVGGSAERQLIVFYLAGGTLLAVTGFIDDIRPLPSAARFLIQIAAALLVILSAGYWHTLALPFISTPLQIGIIGLPLTLVWIVGLTNIYNFMDGIDGIAGGQAVIAGLGWLAISYYAGNEVLPIWSTLVVGGALGFLCHNWHPAKIFMGDVGSTFLGYTFAAMPLLLGNLVHSLHDKTWLVGIALLWPFLLDGSFTIVRRMLDGENILRAHRSHLYQRLVITGKRHDFVSTLYVVLAILGVPFAFFWLLNLAVPTALFGLMAVGVCIFLTRYLAQIENR